MKPFVGNGEICALDVGFDVGSLRGGIIWSLRKKVKTDRTGPVGPVLSVFNPLTCSNETGRAGGEWSSAVRRGVAAAEGAGRHAGWGGRGRAGGRAEELG